MRRLIRLCLILALVIAPSAQAKEIRLGRDVMPTSQEVELHLDAGKPDYSGRVRIELDVRKEADSFAFHAQEMAFDRVSMTGRNGEVALDLNRGEEGYVRARPFEKLKKGKYALEIEFSKAYNTKAVGLYRMENEGTGYLFTQFESLDARRAFPCWDEPSFKIPYRFTIDIPVGQEIVTNTPIETESEIDGKRHVVFAQTKPLPSYLLCIAAGPLESVEIKGLSVPGRIYTTEGQSHLAGLAAELTPGILTALEDYFGRKYPYAKLDLIAVPEYWPGAMENPGAVTYADNLLLFDPQSTSSRQRATFAYVTAHELAHMWFGDLVTMTWWDDLWLNESFADWLGIKISDEQFPEYHVGVEQLAEVQGLLNGDARPSTTPVRRPVESGADINQDFGLAYGKGRTVLGMVERWIGSDKFQKGVRAYMKKHAWGNTVADDLFSALSDAAGRDLRPMLSSFLDQPGYPLVSVAPGQDGKITLSQKRFLNKGVEAENYTWVVPVQLKYDDGMEKKTRVVVLDKPSMTVDLGTEPLWVLPDAGAVGYYRWYVPGDMLVDIATEPRENLSERERAVFLSNTEAMLDAGQLHGDEYLRIIAGFATVHTPEVIDAVITGLSGVESAFVTDDLRDAFGVYVRQSLRPALDAFGMEPQEDEPETIKLLRPRLLLWLGGRGDDEDVLAYCRGVAEKFMTDAASIDPSIGDVAVRVAVKHGNQAEFDTCISLFEDAKVPSVRRTYLRAIGSFEDPALKKAALDYALSGPLRANELFTIPQTIGRTAAGRNLTWQWTMDNYELLTSRIPDEFAAYMPFAASGCEKERVAAAEVFFAEPVHSVDGTSKNLQKVVESVTDCVNLREREGRAVADYLNQLAIQ